jgi:molybdopterin-guanine dinucleotide biosynthesis protein A
VILAGGRGERLGGADKGWVEWAGRPLIVHVLERLAPQVDEVIISANRNLERYADLGCTVASDELPGFQGPLGGLHAAMARARFELVCTVPCDSPQLPLDVVDRLRRGLEASPADVAVARAEGRLHPVFALYRRTVRADLDDYVTGSRRRVEAWQKRLHCVEVNFDDAPEAFRNINAPEDLTGPG